MRTSILFVLLLCACSTTFRHAYKTKDDFRVDLVDCESKFAAMQDGLRATRMVEECLRSKGWQG